MDRYFRQCVVSIWVGVEIVRCFLDKMVGKIAQRSVSRRQLGTVEGTVFIKYIYCLGSLSSCNRLPSSWCKTTISLFSMVADSLGQETGQSVVGWENFVLQRLGPPLGRFSFLEWFESRGLESSGSSSVISGMTQCLGSAGLLTRSNST